MKSISTLILITLFLFSQEASNKVCRDPQGNKVDWFTLFLFPEKSSPDYELHYAYMDSNTQKLTYYKYEEETFPPTHIVRYTLTGNDYNYFFWNDDKTTKDGPSESASNTFAHAKGALVYDQYDGAFLLHSLPRFPTRTYIGNEVLTELPSNAGVNGQHFLCITTTKEQAEEIAKILNYINVSNNKSVKSDRVNVEPNKWITKLIENKFDPSYPKEGLYTVKSQKGETFTVFSKNYLNKITPYDTTLREHFQDSFFVRTWTRPSLAPSICDYFELLNVFTVKWGEYKITKGVEHSKWAVAVNSGIACFGDVNHCASQANRGGNIFCFENEKLANYMREAIVEHDYCGLEEDKKETNKSDIKDTLAGFIEGIFKMGMKVKYIYNSIFE